MSLIWTDPLPDDPTDDGDGTWIWCDRCAGVGWEEVEGHDGMHEEVNCRKCGGVGGWYESLLEREENRQDEAEYREER